tara:strand:+ start:917 stop:1183 length:267 start_codon:yes stop_codon:yes gene_type:complete
MILSNKYRIIVEENTTILQFYKNKVTVKKDGTKIPYEFTENYYYPSLKTALKSYVNKSIGECNDVSKILLRLNELELQIKEIYTNHKL